MTDAIQGFQFFGYGLAAFSHVLLLALSLTSLRKGINGTLLAISAAATAVWAAFLGWGTLRASLTPFGVFLFEMSLDTAWLLFISTIFSGAVAARQVWLIRWGGVLLAAAITLYGVARAGYLGIAPAAAGIGDTLVLGSLLTSLYALVLIEQIYRNARQTQRSGLKYLCLGVGSIFAYDLILYSAAVFAGPISGLLWSGRGFVVAISVPLIVIAARRLPSFAVGIFVSRQVVFHSATLVGSGIYLTVVGFAGYYLSLVGGDWGKAAQVVLLSAAVISLVVLLSSERTRARLRVFISKHFFANKYDYREEWLRLIGTLTGENQLPLRKRSIKALVEILGASAGQLWLRTSDEKAYECVAGWDVTCDGQRVDADSTLPGFLARTGWVVDFEEVRRHPKRYDGLVFDSDSLGLTSARYVVPLLQDKGLLGFVAIAVAESDSGLNFEDRDLLKTAGLQVAGYLAQEVATEQLAEARQFEAYNKLTAYLMHDLKNVSAQLSLLVKNAERHKHKPEFIDDAIDTIAGSVRRVRNVTEHLQQGRYIPSTERVELGKLIMQAVSQCADRDPKPRAQLVEGRIFVRGDKDRLQMAVFHAIRNAQDATTADGQVDVSLSAKGSSCSIDVIDDGTGMDKDFMRDELFKPFHSTKGSQGMGIGAYQLRETVRSMGGEVRVESHVNKGTRITLEFPQAAPLESDEAVN